MQHIWQQSARPPLQQRSAPPQPQAPAPMTTRVQLAPARPIPEAVKNEHSPPPLPPLQQQAEGDEPAPKMARLAREGHGSDVARFGVGDTSTVQAQAAPAANPWAHLAGAAAANKKKLEEQTEQDIKPAQGQQRVRERACLIPAWPPADSTAPPPFRSAFEMLQEERPVLSLGDEYLDAPLQGGLREGITELVGEAACGKTQLAMQMLLQCQLPKSKGGLAGTALYLAVEELPMTRLRSLADSFKRRHPDVTHDVFAKIYIKNIAVRGQGD